MARFQGIPVEEEIQVAPRFQGVPVDAEPQEQKEQDSWPEVIGKSVMQGALAVPKIISEGGHVIRKIAGMPESEFRQKVTEAEKYLQPETEGSKAKELVGQAARTVGEMGSTAAVGGAPAILPLLAGRAGAEKSAKSLDEGYSVPKSLVAGAGQAAIEYFTEKIPLGILQKPGLSFIKRLGMGLVTDVPGELAATAGEMALIDTKVLGKEYNPEQYKQALIDTAIVSGLVTGGATSISHPLVQKPKGPLARAAEKVIQQPIAQEVIQANQESPQVYRDQPQEQVTPKPAYTDAEAQAMERAARIRNTMAITPESQAPSPIETERTLAPVRAQEYAPEVPQGAAWNEELQRQGEQTKAETEKFKPTAEPLTASTDTLIDTFDEIPVNQTPRTITRKAEGGFYGGAPTLPQVIRQKTYTTEKVAKNALKLLKNKINVDEYDVFPATGGWQIRTRDDAAKQKAMAEYNNNLPEDIRDAVIKMESDISQGEVGGNAYNDKSGTTQRYKSTNPKYIQLKTLQAYDKKHGTSLAKIVNKDSIAKVISAVRSGKELTGNNRQVWDYVKEQAANLNKTDTELVSGQEADRITKEGIDIGQKRSVVVGDLNQGDKVVVENKGIPDIVEHKGFDEEGNIILEDGKRFTVDQFDKIDIYGEKKAEGVKKGQQIKSGDTDLTYQGQDAMGLHNFRIEREGPGNKANISTKTLDAEDISKTVEAAKRRFAPKPQIDEILNGGQPQRADVVVDDMIHSVMLKDTKSMREDIKSDIDLDAEGVIPGKLRMLDRRIKSGEYSVDDVAKSFENTRKELRKKYGETVTLYRSDAPEGERSADNITKLYGDKKLASKFAVGGREAKPEKIAVDDIIAGYARDSGYFEFIVKGKQADQPSVAAVTAPPDEARPAASERIAEINKELANLQKQYDAKSAKFSKAGMVPPSIKSSALSGITKKMDKLDAELSKLQEKEMPAEVKETPPSLTKEQGKESDVKYSRAPKSTNTAEQVTAAISKSQRVRQLLKDGRIKVVQGMGDLPSGEMSHSIRTKKDPAKTITAYKLFRVKKNDQGKLFPLFVDANTPLEIGKWYDAESGELTKEGKVKSKLGPLAYRPGWHAGDMPVATHIGIKENAKDAFPSYRNDDFVWAEVEISADVDWQGEANRRAKINKKGEPIKSTAHITDSIPEDGFYRYKTNSNMTGEWIIGGSMKIKKVLDDRQVKEISNKNGVYDLPRRNELILDQFGFSPMYSRDGSISGAYDPKTDTIYLVSDGIEQGQENRVLEHEAFHRMKEQGKIQPILDELGRLEKMAGKKGQVAEWFTKARESAQVDKGTQQYIEEIGAYAVQHYEASPNIIKRWVDKLIAKVKAALFQTFGVMPKNLDPAFLREIALSGLKSGSVKDSLTVGEFAQSPLLSIKQAAKKITDSAAFKKWFGDSKVVDDDGKPMVVYHGTNEDFDAFDLDMLGHSSAGGAGTKYGIFFGEDRDHAEYWGENAVRNRGGKKKIVESFLTIEDPLIVEFDKENGIDLDSIVDEAYNADNDGVIIKGMPDDESMEPRNTYIVFSPTQIKSIFNRGTFDAKDPRILYSKAEIAKQAKAPLFSRVAPKDFNEANKAVDEMMQEDNELWDIPDKATKSDTFLWYIQDKLQPLAKVQSKLGKIPDSINALQKARLQVAKSKADIDDFENEHVKPLTDDMKKSGLSLEDVDEYLYAKHVYLDKVNQRLRQINAKRYLEDLADIKKGLAGKIEDLEVKYDFDSPERKIKYVELLESSFDVNDEAQAKLKARWDRFSEKPSGMTDAEAKSIYESKKSDDLERISGRVSSINDFRVKTLLKAGIISDEEAKAWKGAYKHFVPLKREGFDEQRLPVGRGISDLSKGSKARAGSTRRAVNILANTIASAEQSIVREKKSETMKALVGLIRANPNPDFWSVEKSKKTPGYDTYGNIRMYTTQEDGAEIIPVRLDGERFVIRFGKTNDAGLRIAAALKNDLHNQGPIVNALSVATRALAMVNTSLSPEFVISNFLRDIQTSFYNISDTDVAKLKKKIITDVRKSMPGIWRSLGGNHDTEWAKWTDDYRKNGGMISWLSDYASVEKTAKKLENEVKSATDAKYMAREKFMQIGNLVSRINNTIENAVRVSFYKNAVESGIMTREQAALAAKELTTNFETKGAAGQVINSLYMFANAGIQGSTRIIKAIKSSRKVQGLVGMTIFAGMIMDMFNRSAGGDDDDKMPFYDKIPKYIKERNIIVMLDKGKYIKIPMPWGYNVFFNIGNELGRSMTEKGYDPVESAGRVLYSAINAFNPLQAATIAQTIAPTVADPFVQIWENKSWAGTPMKPENSPFDKTPKPEYQMYWRSAGSLSKAIAKELNDLTGGNEIKPGAINISPAWIDNMYNNVTGALGKFVSGSLGTSYKVLTGEEVETKEKPFIRKVYGGKSDYEDRSLYYERVKEIILDRKQYKEKPEMRKEISAKYQNFPKLVLIADASEKRLLKLGKLKKKSSSDKQNELIDKYMEKVYDNFNRNYNKSTR